MEGVSLNTLDAAVSEQFAEYLSLIAHMDMPLSAKIEMISALQHLVENFVERAWGDDPVQHVNGIQADDEMIDHVVVGSFEPNTNDLSLSRAFAPPAARRREKESE